MDAAILHTNTIRYEEYVLNVISMLTTVKEVDTTREWFEIILKEKQDLCRVIGLPSGNTREALVALIQSDTDISGAVSRLLAQRLAIHLSTTTLAARHPRANQEIQILLDKLHNLRSLIALADPGRRTKSVPSVIEALHTGMLSSFRGSIVDTDLWVVLKTLYEDPKGGTSNQRLELLDAAYQHLTQELSTPGHIPEPRHAWWGIETLIKEGYFKKHPELTVQLHQIIEALLKRLDYSPRMNIIQISPVPELHSAERERVWIGINICRVIQVGIPDINKLLQSKIDASLSIIADEFIPSEITSYLMLTALRLLFAYEYAAILEKPGYGDQIGIHPSSDLAIEKASHSLEKPVTLSHRAKVFISYSHKDKKWLSRLKVHLKPLERRGVIEQWDDTMLQGGDRWRKEIQKAIDTAKVAILLISADFLASDFIMKNELPPLLKRAQMDDILILPIIVSPCGFSNMEALSQFQAVNDPSKPLLSLDKSQRELIFVSVSAAVEAALGLKDKESNETS